MKLIFTILFLFSIPAFATNYYVTNAGSDANAGTSAGTAWQTLHKVSAYSLSQGFVAGDSIFLKRDDTWNDSLRFYSSGTLLNPIVFCSYGTGNTPIITGLQTLSVSNAGGNIWTGTASNSINNQNTVVINDTIRWKARYPNTTTFTYTGSDFTSTYLIIPHSAVNHVGEQVVTNGSTWEINVLNVSSQSNGVTNDTIYFSNSPTYSGGSRGGNGYFFQNNPDYLDSANGWTYNAGTKLISVYALSTPTVQYSSIDTLIKITNQNYIKFQGISFQGANTYTCYFKNVKGISLDGYEIKNASDGVYMLNTKSVSFTNGNVNYVLNDAIASAYDTSLNISNNAINNIGVYAGMGKSQLDGFNTPYIGYTGYSAIFNRGDSFTMANNSIGNVGYVPIYFYGKKGLVSKNFINNYCFIKADGGAIYSYLSVVGNGDSATLVNKNIIKSDTIHPQGILLTGGYDIRAGVYLDQFVSDVIIDSNSISNLYTDIYIKAKNTITNNIIADSLCQQPVLFGTLQSGATFQHNTIYNFSTVKTNFSKTRYSPVYALGNFYDSLENIDYNHFIYTPTDTSNFYLRANSPYYPSGFKAVFTSYDVHSDYSLPATATSSVALYIANNSLTDSAYTFTGNYVDQDGNIYYGSATVKSFTSKLLFPSSSVQKTAIKIGNLKFR